MKPTKEALEQKYETLKHFNIPCFVDNPKLSKLLTGEGASEAKIMFPDYIAIDASVDKEDKYQIWKLASQINENPDVSFFTCVADRNLDYIHVEFWGSEELLTSARLVGENGDIMLKFLLNKED